MPDTLKYAPLTQHLRAASGEVVRMKFAEIERVIGAKLPSSADRNRAYWSNNAANSVLTQAWLAAGYRSEQVDMAARKVVFRRVAPPGGGPAPGSFESFAAGFAEAPASEFSKASATPLQPGETAMDMSSLFGCMAGTIVVNADLTEPADPELAAYLDETYGPFA